MLVSSTSHGLWVIKKLIANTSPINRPILIQFCREHIIELMQDPYGNYALQEIMDKWQEQVFLPLIAEDGKSVVCTTNKIAQLSIQKFSSNVVEKCIKMGNKEQRSQIILQFSKMEKLVNLMQNSFGNYVVQTALELSEGEVRIALTDSVAKSISSIQDKKIRSKWAQLLFNNVKNDTELVEKYNLGEYLQELAQPLPLPMREELQHYPQYSEPNYEQSLGMLQSYQNRNNVKITIEHWEPKYKKNPYFGIKKPEEEDKKEAEQKDMEDPYGTKKDFQVFGSFGLAPQFDGDDSD